MFVNLLREIKKKIHGLIFRHIEPLMCLFVGFQTLAVKAFDVQTLCDMCFFF